MRRLGKFREGQGNHHPFRILSFLDQVGALIFRLGQDAFHREAGDWPWLMRRWTMSFVGLGEMCLKGSHRNGVGELVKSMMYDWMIYIYRYSYIYTYIYIYFCKIDTLQRTVKTHRWANYKYSQTSNMTIRTFTF